MNTSVASLDSLCPWGRAADLAAETAAISGLNPWNWSDLLDTARPGLDDLPFSRVLRLERGYEYRQAPAHFLCLTTPPSRQG